MKSSYKTITTFVFSMMMLTGVFLLTSASVSAQKENTKLAKEAKITMEQARETALKRAPGKIEEGELEKENGKLVYSFDIRTSDGMITEVQVDAKSGEIVSVEKEDAAKEAAEKKQDKMERSKKDDDDDEESDASRKANQEKYAKMAKITMDEAKTIALKEKNGTITDQELEKKKGRILYSFDVKTSDGKVFDIEVDAKSGKVLKVEEDKEDEQDDDN